MVLPFMATKWVWELSTRLGAMLLIIFIAWEAWDYFGPHKPEIGLARKQMADQLMPQIIEDIHRARQTVRSAAMLHLAGDPSDYVTDQLRLAVERSGVLDIQDRTLGEKGRNAFRLRNWGVAGLPEAVAEGKIRGVDSVVFGTIHTLESVASSTKIDLELTLADARTGQSLLTRRYTRDTTGPILSSAAVQEQVRRFGWQRMLGWVLIVVLLPVFTIGFIRTMVCKESNKANAFVLGIYTAVGTLLAYLVVGADFSSWWSSFFFLAMTVVAFGYNVTIMSFALRLEEA